MTASPQSHVPDYAASPLAGHTGGLLRPGGLGLTERLVQGAGLPPEATLLDLACGEAQSVAHLRSRGFRAMGLDCSEVLLRRGASVPRCRGDAMRLPVRKACLDAVLCECALSLVPDAGAMLREVRRCLKPGAALLLSDLYQRDGNSVDSPEHACCVLGARNRSELLQLLSEHGLAPERFEDHTPHLTQLAAELVFAHGSLQDFWKLLLPDGLACHAAAQGRSRKPGYCLVTARRS